MQTTKKVVFSLVILLAAMQAACSDDDGSSSCGNGVIDTDKGEQCDGSNLGGRICEEMTEYDFYGGVLGCHPPGHENECQFDVTNCIGPECGDNLIDHGEECDGSNLDGNTCVSLGWDGGELACVAPGSASECHLDTSGCRYSPFCGDHVADVGEGEECDGNDFAGVTCETMGYLGGTLVCNPAGHQQECRIDSSGCTEPVCGNNALEMGETCDGTDLGGETCVTRGFITGDLDCLSDCSDFDLADCSGTPVCGNGIQEGLEGCDSTDFAGQTCQGLGYLTGELACHPAGHASECTLDATGCVGSGNCTVDHNLGLLQMNGTLSLSSNLATADDENDLACGLQPGYRDEVIAFTLNERGTLRVDYDVTTGMLFSFGLFEPTGGACTDTELNCQMAIPPPTGTIFFGVFDPGTYYFVIEEIPISNYSDYTVDLKLSAVEVCNNNIDDDGNQLADCADGTQCCGEAHCSSNPNFCVPDGQGCTADASCMGSVCLDETSSGAPGGYCVTKCRLTNPVCPGNEVCTDYRGFVVGNGYCFADCTVDGDCRQAKGYVCNANPWGPTSDTLCRW